MHLSGVVRVTSPRLLDLIANTLSIDPAQVTEQSTSKDTQNWDSLRQVILMTELERICNIEFEFEQINDATSVSRIRSFLQAKGVELA